MKRLHDLLLKDKRLLLCALLPAAFLSFLTVLCSDVRTDHSLDLPLWQGAALFVLWTAVFLAVLLAAFGLMNRLHRHGAAKESLFSKITGHFLVVFVLLIISWIPAWLAYWPGTFPADSLTQFYTYYNGDHTTHHPLLHTLMLGFIMMLGIDSHPEAHATWGLIWYCAIQLALVAGCVAYAITWLRRRGVPAWIRIAVTLLFMLNPFYAPWNFNAQKDVLFGALVLVFCLQLADLWAFGMKPLRACIFVLISALMMLFRNNGIYAVALLLPFAVWWIRKRRICMAALLAGSMALCMAVNAGLAWMLDAQKGSKVEMLSIPLQQIARTLKEDPEAIQLDTKGVVDTLYEGTNPAEVYYESLSDPVKWSLNYSLLDENLADLLSLWVRMLPGHLTTYVEAFVEQNLPYLLPGSEMIYRFDFGLKEINWFPIEENCYLPKLRAAYDVFEETPRFLNIPGTGLLSDAAFYVWLTVAGLAYACLRRKYGLMAAFVFLLALWLTLLLGPVALMRYLLGLYNAVPVLLAALLIPDSPTEKAAFSD